MQYRVADGIHICPKCYGERQAQREKREEELEFRLDEELRQNVLLTTETFPPFKVEKRPDVVTAECVFGMNLFRDLFTVARDIVGGRSKATQKVLRDARHVVLNKLRKEAALLGANGVIGVRPDYNEGKRGP